MAPASSFAFADILKVLDALPMGVLMVSPEGKVMHMNQSLAALTGFNSDPARGLPCRHVLRSRCCVAGCELGCRLFDAKGSTTPPPLWREELEQGLAALASGRPLAAASLETDLLTLKKRKVPVRLTHFPVHDASGRELFRLDIIEDLTELKNLETRLHQAHGHGKIIGRSAAMERLTALIPNIAPSGAPVLITGETGTGKDLLAETLHQASQRSREPFIRVNVSPLPEEMLVAELFGHTGPDTPEQPGRFQQASGGTLYIAEIADLPKGLQTRLAAYLDTGSILPVGATRETRPNVRLVTATNRDPDHLVRQGLLSRDLFHRLNTVHLILPPLRERKEDIDFLLRHYLELFAARFKKQFTGFSGAARDLLAGYNYPGNVRELKNIVEYAAMICNCAEIDVDSLPAHLGTPLSETGVDAEPRQGKQRKGKKTTL